ncbi:four helix bundle protein [Candidatus Daviesbacteria bacterium]|nr:four helix bundle protein [Candidatus Daviesbacteria bacterium]
MLSFLRYLSNLKMNPIKKLLTYRYAEILFDLGYQFVKKYIDYKSRTKDQLEQALRSGKQNIVEGVSASPTSKSTEIKLLGVAKASFEEALADFEDYLRINNLEVYLKTDPRVTKFRQKAYQLSDLRNLSNLGHLIEKPRLPGNPQDDANFLLTLCHQVTFLLDRQIKAAIVRFEKEGGISEKLHRDRVKYLKTLK